MREAVGEVVVAGCWLAAAAVWRAPRVSSAGALLRAVLRGASDHQVLDIERRGVVSLRDVIACVRDVWRRSAAGADDGGEETPDEARQAALLVAGRALAAAECQPGSADDARALLAVLALPPAHHHRNTPEHLKVLVGASKLQILFSQLQ
ncbi:unnamed protein product [Leptidea sinapis]|uniref:Uncharacterized protein n=1 Tax=Leptidea sinapis TaxID=189913 RepID=A0A5E4Q9F8_9NEOP|nr:unnamed protein product [Leptidea sinapis]